MTDSKEPNSLANEIIAHAAQAAKRSIGPDGGCFEVREDMPQEKVALTPEVIDKQLDAISKHADKNERLAWIRKMKKLQELVGTLEPFEKAIFDLIMQKQPIMDEIGEIRTELVKVCIHPKDSLTHLDTHAICKFCNRKISLPEVDTGEDE